MQAAEVLVRIFEKEGVKDAFGIPGAGINPVYKYLKDSPIKHYTMRHEEAAVHAADGYFRASGKISAAICTSGPGATNFITGLYTAQIDSIPLIALTGQSLSSLMGKEAFQCVDICASAKPFVKGAWFVGDAKKLPEILKEAFRTARAGRPGPVLIDFPLDQQQIEVDFDPAAYSSAPIEKPAPKGADISAAADLLLAAEKPLILMGGGTVLANGHEALVQLAEYLQIPVVTTYMAKGGIPDGHPLDAGHAGTQVGNPLGNKVFLDSDLVLAVGCRFTDRHTGKLDVYRGKRKFIHIDIEPTQIGRIFPADLGIVADAKLAVEALSAEVRGRLGSPRKSGERALALPKLRAELARKTDYAGPVIKAQRVLRELNAFGSHDPIYTTGCGLNQIWSGQIQTVKQPRRYLPSGGAGTLGFDIPAAIGAAVATGTKQPAIAVMGDFGFTFLVEELAVAAKYRLPVKVVVLNNAGLSLIRQNQKYAYGFEYAVEMKENKELIDYVKVSEGFGCKAERVADIGKLSGAIASLMESTGPHVVEVLVEDETDCAMGAALDAIREFD